jgi:hypothetical protein
VTDDPEAVDALYIPSGNPFRYESEGMPGEGEIFPNHNRGGPRWVDSTEVVAHVDAMVTEW